VVLDEYAGSCFIAVSSLRGYDIAQHIRAEERRMKEDSEHSPAGELEERSSRGQASRGPKWLAVLATLALAGAVIGVIVYGYLARPGWIGVADKTFWDYLELLIVPAALALGVYWLNRLQSQRDREADAVREREREADAAQREREREASEEAQKQRELTVQNQRAQDEALQAYLDQMSRLLVDKERPLRRASSQRKDDLSVVAEAWTSSVLARLDGHRKQIALLFLQDAGLILVGQVAVSLAGADLRGARLVGPYPTFVDLDRADLTWADLSGADLSGARFLEASLRSAKLHKANLSGAFLLRADISEADLSGADLSGTDLRFADLRGVKGLTEEQLISAKSFEYAIMPDGKEYRDWVVDTPQGRRWLKKYKE
jgi:uncharacterized protein YjbI with pentapeptide repeats